MRWKIRSNQLNGSIERNAELAPPWTQCHLEWAGSVRETTSQGGSLDRLLFGPLRSTIRAARQGEMVSMIADCRCWFHPPIDRVVDHVTREPTTNHRLMESSSRLASRNSRIDSLRLGIDLIPSRRQSTSEREPTRGARSKKRQTDLVGPLEKVRVGQEEQNWELYGS